MRFQLLALGALSATVLDASPTTRSCPTVLERDVLIIGGGGSGAYAAVRLHDLNKTIAVVELADKLGGHTNTFYDPATGGAIDYGVQGYIRNEALTNFFGRFNVPIEQLTESPLPTIPADFKTGIVLEGAAPPNQTELAAAMIRYAAAAAQFPFLASGAYDLPDDVPADLLLPFRDYIAKYDLAAALPIVWTFAQGVGNLFEATTLHVLQNFGIPHLQGLTDGYMYAPGGNQAVFDRAGEFLGEDVLYSSIVTECTRTDKGVRAVVKTPDGNVIVKAKKLLITIPPTAKNLEGFDLDDTETSLFSEWIDVPYYVGIVSKNALPPMTNFINVNPTQLGGIPEPPLVWRLENVGVPGYLTVKVIGERDSEKARNLVKSAVSGLEKTMTGASSGTTKVDPWFPHRNLQFHVSPEALQAGFYRDLYALQGQKSTYYAGNALCSDYSPLLWNFLEERILPHL